jgi:hypothetical protein
LEKTQGKNGFQTAVDIHAVQACCVVSPWDMAEAIPVETESAVEEQSDRREIGDVQHSVPLAEDIDRLRTWGIGHIHRRNGSTEARSHGKGRVTATDDSHWTWG